MSALAQLFTDINNLIPVEFGKIVSSVIMAGVAIADEVGCGSSRVPGFKEISEGTEVLFLFEILCWLSGIAIEEYHVNGSRRLLRIVSPRLAACTFSDLFLMSID